MTSPLLTRVADWIRDVARRIWRSLGPCSSGTEVVGVAADVVCSRRDLIIENAMLRHQINVLHRSTKRPRLGLSDRLKLLLGAV
jgi:hypothetical protein